MTDTAPVLLFASAIQSEAHEKLADVLASGDHPEASCIEDHESPEPYQVWSCCPLLHGDAQAKVTIDPVTIDHIVELVLAQLKG